MIVACEQCRTNFNLDESLLQPTGSKVRCSKCQHVFTAFPPSPVPAPEPAPTPVAADSAAPDDVDLGLVPGEDELVGDDDLRLVALDQFEGFRGPIGRQDFDGLASQQALERLEAGQGEALYVERTTAPGIRRIYGILTRQMVESSYR